MYIIINIVPVEPRVVYIINVKVICVITYYTIFLNFNRAISEKLPNPEVYHILLKL